MKESVCVSVIIRTKNRPARFIEAVQSVIHQTYRPIQIVVVNDGGSDVRPLLQSDTFVSQGISIDVYTNLESKGRSAAANLGLENANGQLAVFLDDDDYFDAEHLSLLVSAWHKLKQNSDDLLCVYSNTKVVNTLEDGTEQTIDIIDNNFDHEKLYYGNFLPILSVLFPVDIMTLGVKFDEDFDLFEDWDFWLQVSQHCAFHHTPVNTCAYRVNLSDSGVHTRENSYQAYSQIYEKWLCHNDKLSITDILANSHYWHEERISQLQDCNQLEFKRIGELHSNALSIISSKDKNIEHLEHLHKEALDVISNKDKDIENLSGLYEHAVEVIASKDEVIKRKSQEIQLLAELSLINQDIIKSREANTVQFKRQLKRAWFFGLKSLLSPDKYTKYMDTNVIDIIVPVYRSLRDTKLCIESVLKTVTLNRTSFQLIVIDDCSPEPEVSDYLIAAANSGLFKLIRNHENLGFVGTVNKGMELNPDRDVLLLNSDTVVVNNWVDRIYDAAYASDTVGSVTPFSNNATICSYPTFCQDNDLPTHVTLTKLDSLFSTVNANQSCEIPTAIGFCMFIKRQCLNEVGLFDMETFGKGYGEENDFSQRAIKAGWSNHFAWDVFVNHTGNVSFGDSHNEKKFSALEKLADLHPDYELQVHKHIQQDPAKEARVRTWLGSLRCSDQPLVVHISHNRGGGTQRFIDELSHEISPKVHSLLLTNSVKKPGYLCLTTVSQNDKALSIEETEYCLYFDAKTQSQQLINFFRKLPVAAFHYHHLLDLPEWIINLAKRVGKPWFVSVHDYYLACVSITLTDKEGKYCGPSDLDIETGTIDTSVPSNATEAKTRRDNYLEFLTNASACYTPSLDTKRRMQFFFPTVEFQSVYHQQARQFSKAYDPVIESSNPRPIKVLVIGALSKIKGADLLEELAVSCKKQKLAIEFELLGYAYRELIQQPKSNLCVSGAYSESDLNSLIQERIDNNAVDLVWFTAQWPETFSYTLSNAIEAKLPILAPNMGAFSERLYERPYSWVINQNINDITGFFTILYQSGFGSKDLDQYRSTTSPALSDFSYIDNYPALLVEPIFYEINKEELNRWLTDLEPFFEGEPTAKETLKAKLLIMLYKVKAHPMMRPIMKRVSPQLQTRVKSYFLK